jgi:hypothetical protein
MSGSIITNTGMVGQSYLLPTIDELSDWSK